MPTRDELQRALRAAVDGLLNEAGAAGEVVARWSLSYVGSRTP